MAITEQSREILSQMLDGLTPEQRAILDLESIEDLCDAIGQLMSKTRCARTGKAMQQIVSGDVADWDALESLSFVADGGTIYDRLTSFTTAMTAHQAAEMLAHAVCVALAAKKHFRV